MKRWYVFTNENREGSVIYSAGNMTYHRNGRATISEVVCRSRKQAEQIAIAMNGYKYLRAALDDAEHALSLDLFNEAHKRLSEGLVRCEADRAEIKASRAGTKKGAAQTAPTSTDR